MGHATPSRVVTENAMALIAQLVCGHFDIETRVLHRSNRADGHHYRIPRWIVWELSVTEGCASLEHVAAAYGYSGGPVIHHGLRSLAVLVTAHAELANTITQLRDAYRSLQSSSATIPHHRGFTQRQRLACLRIQEAHARQTATAMTQRADALATEISAIEDCLSVNAAPAPTVTAVSASKAIDLITGYVSDAFGIAPALLQKTESRRKNEGSQLARWMAWDLIMRFAHVGSVRAGRVYGYDHSTVGYGLRQLAALQTADPDVAQTLDALRTRCHASFVTLTSVSGLGRPKVPTYVQKKAS